ncbi:MAG: hypothetical protein LBP81_05420 [Treponema sp.]|jgi:hypothetical protein|nr:hypothetical protein [Treponema sp.]
MKKKDHFLLIIPVLYWAAAFAGCNRGPTHYIVETKTSLCKTNLIGIAGEYSEEPYIEIAYSAADESNPGHNKKETIMVSPPYVFQNDRVYIQYDVSKGMTNSYFTTYTETLHRDWEEGGAEYLRIINHSPDKTVEFFFAGGQELPESAAAAAYKMWRPSFESSIGYLPAVHYKMAPVQYLLFPDRRPGYNYQFQDDFPTYYFEGNRCGDFIVTKPWTVDEIAALYRAEYNRSNTIILYIDGDYSSVDEETSYRMIDYVQGRVKPHHVIHSYLDAKFWGTIKPGETLKGDDKIGLLATCFMYTDEIFYLVD